MADLYPRPITCPNCGALVRGDRITLHMDEHEALIQALELLMARIKSLEIAVGSLLRKDVQ